MNTFRQVLVKSAASTAFGCVVLLSNITCAMAQDAASEPRHVYTVRYSDLNLETQQGAKILLSRLLRAARIVCQPLEDRELSVRAHWQVCVDQALASAVSHVNNKAVTALYQSSLAPNSG